MTEKAVAWSKTKRILKTTERPWMEKTDDSKRLVLDMVRYNGDHYVRPDFVAAIQKRHDDGWRVYEPLTHINPLAWSHVWYYRYEDKA